MGNYISPGSTPSTATCPSTQPTTVGSTTSPLSQLQNATDGVGRVPPGSSRHSPSLPHSERKIVEVKSGQPYNLKAAVGMVKEDEAPTKVAEKSNPPVDQGKLTVIEAALNEIKRGESLNCVAEKSNLSVDELRQCVIKAAAEHALKTGKSPYEAAKEFRTVALDVRKAIVKEVGAHLSDNRYDLSKIESELGIPEAEIRSEAEKRGAVGDNVKRQEVSLFLNEKEKKVPTELANFYLEELQAKLEKGTCKIEDHESIVEFLVTHGISVDEVGASELGAFYKNLMVENSKRLSSPDYDEFLISLQIDVDRLKELIESDHRARFATEKYRRFDTVAGFLLAAKNHHNDNRLQTLPPPNGLKAALAAAKEEVKALGTADFTKIATKYKVPEEKLVEAYFA